MGRIVGIDLGTTNSLIATIVDNEPQLIPNERGNYITPSVVGFTETGELLVGEPAKNQLVANPERTVASIKRLMGSDRRITIGEKDFSPQEISAVILKKLKLDAEMFLHEQVEEAVITVPAYFTDAQRQATKDAGEIAGFKVERIINEPTAAALAYGFDKVEAKTVLVYDLGGGTLDVSIIKLHEGAFKVLATAGINTLGGDDFDYRIVEYLIGQFKEKEKVDINTIPDLAQQRSIKQRLKEAAEGAKIDLSSLLETNINLPFLYTGGVEPLHLNENLTRAKLEEICKELIEQTSQPMEGTIADANLSKDDIDSVILVGGQTRMPAVQRLVKQIMGKDPMKDVNPEECVAMGAAIQAGIKRGHLQDLVVVDVAPFTLGIEVEGGRFSEVIPRNTSVPCNRKRIYVTTMDNQTEAHIHVLQGESPTASENASLGEFILTGITAAPKGESIVEVSFDYDVNGIVKVTARDRKTGAAKGITIKSSKARLTEEDVRLAERDVAKFTGSLLTQREKSKVIFEAQESLSNGIKLLKRVEAKDTRMSDQERLRLEQILKDLKEAIMGEDETQLENLVEMIGVFMKDFG